MAAHCRHGAWVCLALASGVAAQNTNCRGRLGDDEVRGNLNVAVPCTLAGSEIRGNVTIYAGGSLTARDASIRGNVDARRADFVDLADSRVDGNVRLDELVGDRSTLSSTEIRGNVSLLANRSLVELLDNEIEGTVRAVANVGGIVIAGNEIDGGLECAANAPAPTGGANRVRRRESGQCTRLQPSGGAIDPPPGVEPPPPAPTPPPPPPAAPPVPIARADLTPPTLTLRGASTVSVLVDSAYTDAGASAIDDVDGDLTARIVVASNVDTKTLGIYAVTYSVSDRAGNAAPAVTRTVNVTPKVTTQEGPGGGGALGLEWLALLLAARSRRSSRMS